MLRPSPHSTAKTKENTDKVIARARPLLADFGGGGGVIVGLPGDQLTHPPTPSAAGWLLLFLGGLWMVVVISWWALDGCCYSLVGSGWLLLLPGGLWTLTVNFFTLKLQGDTVQYVHCVLYAVQYVHFYSLETHALHCRIGG